MSFPFARTMLANSYRTGCRKFPRPGNENSHIVLQYSIHTDYGRTVAWHLLKSLSDDIFRVFFFLLASLLDTFITKRANKLTLYKNISFCHRLEDNPMEFFFSVLNNIRVFTEAGIRYRSRAKMERCQH